MVVHSRPSAEQLQTMVDYMDNHRLFARKQIPKLGESGVDTYRKMWSTLSDILNAIGEAELSPEQWKNFWDNERLNAQTAMKNYLYWSRQTGIHNVEPLPDITMRICAIFGHYGAGPSLVPEVGVYAVQINIPEKEEDDCWLESSDASEQMSQCIINHEMQQPASGSNLAMEQSREKRGEKLSTEEKMYIVSFVDQKGGNPSLDDWEEIAMRPLLAPFQQRGEWYKAYWETIVSEALNKQTKISASATGKLKLTKVEEAIIKVIQGSVNDSVQKYVNSPCNSGPNTSTAQKTTLSKRVVEPGQIQPPPTKRQKLTSLQVQKDGLKAIEDGNETLCYLTDVLTDCLKTHEMALKAHTGAVENFATQVTEAIKRSEPRRSQDLNFLGNKICSTLFAIHSMKTKGYITPKEERQAYEDFNRDIHVVPDFENEEIVELENGEIIQL